MFYSFFNTDKSPKRKILMKSLFKHALALPLLLAAFLVAPPAAAQSTAVNSSNPSANSAATTKYEGVYVVIKADTKQETLMRIEEKLKKVGVDFKVIDITFKDALITGITITVNVPGIYSGTVTSGKNQESLAGPIYFYSEAGKAGLSSGEMPGGISARGRLVITDNLNGAAILYDNDNMELSGSATTKWKSR